MKIRTIMLLSLLLACWSVDGRAGVIEDRLLDGKRQAALGTEKDIAQSIEKFKEIIATNPNYTQAYIEAADAQSLIASMYWRRRKQNIFGLLSTQVPDQEQIKGLYEEALGWTEKALELAPASADPSAIAALINKNLGNAEEAKRLAEQALTVNPDSLRALRAYLLIVPEDAKLVEEKRQRLINQYKEELSKDPSNALLHVGLGVQYLALNQKDPAKTEFEQAIQQSPACAYPYLYLTESLPWQYEVTPWKKVNLLRDALKTVGDDPVLLKYQIAYSITSSVYLLATSILWVGLITYTGRAGCLLKLALSFFLLVCVPAMMIVQYYAPLSFGSALLFLNNYLLYLLFALAGFLVIRGILLLFGGNLYKHRIIYNVTEPLVEPVKRIFPDSWSEAVCHIVIFGELYFLITFFTKLLPRLLQMGQVPWI